MRALSRQDNLSLGLMVKKDGYQQFAATPQLVFKQVNRHRRDILLVLSIDVQ